MSWFTSDSKHEDIISATVFFNIIQIKISISSYVNIRLQEQEINFFKFLNKIKHSFFSFLNELFYNISTDIDDDFLEFIKLLVPYVVSEGKVTTKRMNGKDVKGKDMLVYIKVRLN